MSPKKKYTLAFSPCPNDTFMFHAMINGLVDTEGLEFEYVLEDIETLNNSAFKKKHDITKLSFNALGFLADKYVLLNSGSALGRACGPLLISRKPDFDKEISDLKIAIPGKYTTANLLLTLMWPEAKNKVPMQFSKIEDAILKKEVDAGLIIHENRFTYEAKGLNKICDLGEWWENLTGLPIPLGGIAVSRSIDAEITRKIDRILNASINFAFNNPEVSRDFVMNNAAEIDENVAMEHIKLYVNDYSLNLGADGRKAIEILFQKAVEVNIYDNIHSNLFV